MDDIPSQHSSEIDELLEHCERICTMTEYLELDGFMYAEFIWNYPRFTEDFDAEISILLHTGDMVSILFGCIHPDDLKRFAETILISTPHVISSMSYSINGFEQNCVMFGATAYC